MKVKLSEVGDEDLYPDRPDELDVDESDYWENDECQCAGAWEDNGDMDYIGD